jgi:hypothetical protein
MNPDNKKKPSRQLTLREKLEIVEYKKENNSTPDTRIAELFSSKFSKKFIDAL